jgi:hypothetical protein
LTTKLLYNSLIVVIMISILVSISHWKVGDDDDIYMQQYS